MSHARPLIALFALALVAFWPLILHPTETLYSDTSDLLAEHLPAKLFLVRSLRETGELPLWNPEQYAGSPFVHDIQVGLFYPPHLPLYFISEPAVGPFLSWLVFVHVVLAGWLMYAYARHAGMDRLAAFTAGAGFMLAPRWMMQLFLAGHTVTQGICWIPLALLCVERAIQRRNLRWAVGGGAAYALLILGTHPQWTFYGSLLIGLWPLRLLVRERTSRERQRPEAAALAADYGEPGRVSAGSGAAEPEAQAKGNATPSLALQAPPVGCAGNSGRTLAIRWFLAELIVALTGLTLSAVQLLPTMEAAGESSRARGMGQSWSLDGAKAAATTLIGPIPDRKAEPIHWETRGGIGFGWAMFAIVGARLGGRRAIVPAAIAIGMLAYALGGSYFIDRLPGFDNFRMPTRMLLTLAFPVAFLAGLGVGALEHERATTTLRLATAVLIVILLNMGMGSYYRGSFPIHVFSDPGPAWWTYWIVVAGAWAVFLAFVAGRWARKRMRGAATLLLLDALIAILPWPDTRLSGKIYPRTEIIDYIREHNPDGLRVYDDGDGSLLGPGSPNACVHGIPSLHGYNPLDVARYRQFIAFIAGVPEPQQAFSGEFTHPVALPQPVRCPALLDLAGARYIVPHGSLFGESLPVGSETKVFDFLTGGVILHRGVRVIENKSVLPRAFQISRAVPQSADGDVLDQLNSIDVSRVATIDDWDPATAPLPPISVPPGSAKIESHSPNQIRIALNGQSAGLLVLTDPWYPGWKCWVDGQETKIWKADYAFRGVMVPAGSKEVVFKFEPRSYRRGRIISLGALVGLVVFGIAVVRRRLSVHRRLTPAAHPV